MFLIFHIKKEKNLTGNFSLFFTDKKLAKNGFLVKIFEK